MTYENEPQDNTVRRRLRKIGASTLAVASAMYQIAPAFAAIDNTATASGTYNAGTTTSPSSGASVPVTSGAPTLTTVKSVSVAPTIAAGADATISDAGDTITFQYVVTNTGNVTITGVTPVESATPTFNGTAGTGTYGAFSPAPVTLAPGASQTFTAVYTMTALDVFRGAGIANGVSNIANATGTPASGTLSAPNSAAVTTTIPAGPKLQIVKAVIAGPGPGPGGGATGGTADVGEFITYRYRVTNNGNVSMTNVSVTDIHEGTALPAGSAAGETLVTEGPLAPAQTSTDTTVPLDNGVWTVIRPGATVDFFYIHQVTQAEFDAG